MKKYLSLIIFNVLPNISMAATDYGVELDALPWLTGGYYLSGWYGKDHLRYRGVVANIKVPDSFIDEGFKDKDITAYAMIVDYFPRRNLTGIWYGAGLEYWQSKITNKTDNATAEYDNTVFTVGLGYVWQLTESIYLNPWAALHIVVAGDKDITVGSQTYQQETTTPSGSIKLGWQF